MKETLILFHDSLGCTELWRDFPRQLAGATGKVVVSYDRLGFGRSDPYLDSLPSSFIDDEASSVVPELCEFLRLDTIIAFGHSVGGAMAIVTAAHLPQKVSAVITESAQSFVEDQTLAGIRAAQADFEKPGQVERLIRYHDSKARWVLSAWINAWLSPAFATWSLDDNLGTVQCPVLAIHGDRDEFGSRENADRIVRLGSNGSRAAILEYCGHIPHREQPARVLSEVKLFLNGLLMS